jgi:hypothetical protein
MNKLKKLYKDFFGYTLNEAAHVPSNIMDFAKRKGPYVVALVKKAATWAEKSGKQISGGTAIGKNYNTIILDIKYQGAEIYINLDNETIKLFGEPVTDAKSFARVFNGIGMSNSDNVIFSINDEKLDDILRANHDRELDYKKDVTGDVYYILPKKEFDRFIDYADSSGYDVDYENSEDSVIYVRDSDTNLREQANGNGSTKEPELDEAKLVNGIDEYQGGVVYAIKDPAQAQALSDDIKAWVEKKGFTIIKRTISKSGKNGYFYFRLGEDPAKDAQRIQGYFAQRLELAAFKFKVRGSENSVSKSPAPEMQTKQPIRKI